MVFERSGFVSYANCGLAYYIGDVITAPEELTLQTPESFSPVPCEHEGPHEVKAIHPDRKTVSVKNLETGEEFEESYDKLILSPGAKPAQPRLPGVGLENLFTLRTVEDTFRIKDHINKHNPKSVVLAGGGFIGLELAENLRELSMDVTIVQRPKQLMNPFDADMASFIHAEARKHGVKLALGYTVEGFEEKDGGVDVLLKDSAPLHADMVVLAIGHHAGHRSRERSWSGTGDQGQYRGQRPDGDICAGHLCRGRCGAGEALCHRRGCPDLPGRSRQQAGAHHCGQYLRRRQPLFGVSGKQRDQGI